MTQLSLGWLEDATGASPPTHAPSARARRRDPQTSKDAAVAADAFVASHEAKCYAEIHDAGERGATAQEIAQKTGLTVVQVCRRLGEMGERKIIVRRLKEQPRTPRDFESRHRMTVWRKA